jgi:hypothetical protein
MRTALIAIAFVAAALVGSTMLAADKPAPVPFPTLDPPAGITPAQTRLAFSWSFPDRDTPGLDVPGRLPRKTWTAAERAAYLARVDWFHKAKYGLFFHFLSAGKWTSEEWNNWVDGVDVEKVADQAKELGAGYVGITLGQNQKFSCAPNPVLDKYWQLKPGQYCARRDLPMDLAKALDKRGIALLLYFATDNQHRMPRPDSFQGTDRYEHWLEVAQWYSDHYGTQCKAWWVDGLKTDWTRDYRVRIHEALKHGNPDALVMSEQYEISDVLHGHCTHNWRLQSRVVKPYFGRWDPDFNIQWHVFQFVGPTWGAPGCDKPTKELVTYASDVVRGGGVITFDVATFRKSSFSKYPSGQPAGAGVGPYLEVQPDQFAQLKAVRDAVKDIPVSDGSGR